jgi:hypothetical protein
MLKEDCITSNMKIAIIYSQLFNQTLHKPKKENESIERMNFNHTFVDGMHYNNTR